MPIAFLPSTKSSDSPSAQHRNAPPTGSSTLSSSILYSQSNTSVLNHSGGTQLEIAVIESTMLIQEYDNKKKKRVRRVLTVSRMTKYLKHSPLSLLLMHENIRSSMSSSRISYCISLLYAIYPTLLTLIER